MAKGFIIDNDNDILIENGSFLVDADDNDNLGIISMAEIGTIGAAPFIGGGFKRLPNSSTEKILKTCNQLAEQLSLDNWRDIEVDFDGTNILLDGTR